MVPRFAPYLGIEELRALSRCEPNAVALFEQEFARTFGAKHALSFPYGRSALWAFFKALGITNAEVIMPAYTCVVVAHAAVLSGNIPRFVDIKPHDYNMDLDKLADAINERTQVVIATHLFGYPLDIDHVEEIIRDAEVRFGRRIWLVQDCAHAFGAHWRGRMVCNSGDVSVFGLNISKMITSIFGGMLTASNATIADQLRTWRDKHFYHRSFSKSLRRISYLLATYAGFNEYIYGMVNWLQEHTRFLDRFTKAYHLDEKIHFPPDYLDHMLAVEADVGLAQLRKYPEVIRRREDNALFYDRQLRGHVPWKLPPIVDGATYSHYVVRVPDRERMIKALAHKGVQLGRLIEYSIPHMSAYSRYASSTDFPVALACSQSTVNLPVQAGLSESQRNEIVRWLRYISA